MIAAEVRPIDTPMAVTMPGLQRHSSMIGIIWKAAALAAAAGSRGASSAASASAAPASPAAIALSRAIWRSKRSRAIASMPNVLNSLRMMSYGGRSPCSRSRWCGTSSFAKVAHCGLHHLLPSTIRTRGPLTSRTIGAGTIGAPPAHPVGEVRGGGILLEAQGRSSGVARVVRSQGSGGLPHHGAAVIEATEVRTMPDGEEKEFFVLRMTHGDLTLKVPVDKAEEIGMRYPISVEDVEDVFEVLAKKDVREPTNWSRRFKNHQEKLKSGDVYQVAEVVRNLALRDADKGLSAGEKSMFVKARQVLVSELAFALDISEDEALDRLAKTLALTSPPRASRRGVPSPRVAPLSRRGHLPGRALRPAAAAASHEERHMSDVPQGPGWWRASDDKWYPPPRPTMPGEEAAVAASSAPLEGMAPPMNVPSGQGFGPPMGPSRCTDAPKGPARPLRRLPARPPPRRRPEPHAAVHRPGRGGGRRPARRRPRRRQLGR